MTAILNTLLLTNTSLNYDTSLIIYYYYIKNKIEKLIKNKFGDYPFNLNCNLNKLYIYIYQLNIYKLCNYEKNFNEHLQRFIKCYMSMYSFYDNYDILNIYEKINIFKINLIYKLVI